MTSIADWANFYVIVGSSAGALIGLQFVVVTLIARTPAAGSQAEASAAFATPTVVHFGTVLLLAAARRCPERSGHPPPASEARPQRDQRRGPRRACSLG